MKNFYPEEIAKILGGNLITRNNKHTAQTFTTQPEDEPLRGSFYFLFDGCNNEEELLKKIRLNCATGIIIRKKHKLDVNKWNKEGISIIEVPHIKGPYIELSKIYRDQFNIPFIEVIGSSGKTTTKEILGSVLNEKMPALVSYKNYNAPSGIAYNIFCLRDKHKAAVLEAGMKCPGIMEYSSNIIKPDIAILTSIHRAHLVSMGSIDNIIKAKAEILKCISEKGTLIMNGEDKNCSRFPIESFKGEVLRFGFSNKFDIYAADIRYKNFKTFFKALGKGFEVDCVMNTVGIYNVSNALAAILAGLKLGLSPQEISAGLSRFKTLKGRLKFFKGINNSVLIDDNLNANPDSTSLLINDIPHFSEGRPTVLIIGDMEQPGNDIEEYARKVHFVIGQQIPKAKLRYLIAIGKWAKEYINGALSQGFPKENTAFFATIEDAKEQIFDYAVPNSIILFKASKYTDVSKLVKPLRAD